MDARAENRLIALPDGLVPRDLHEGYAIQNEIITKWKPDQAGWKVAITSKELMEKAGVSEPVSGPLFSRWTETAPAKEVNGSPTLYGFEFEFAFKIAKDLPPKQSAYTLDEVKQSIESMHLAIEAVGTRYTSGPMDSGVNAFAADHGGNFSLIYGPAVPGWDSIDLSNVEVVAFFDDEEVGRSLGSSVLGNPLNSLTWLANHLIDRGYALKAGDLVTTGAAIGPIPKKPPVVVSGQFGDLGRVEFDFRK